LNNFFCDKKDSARLVYIKTPSGVVQIINHCFGMLHLFREAVFTVRILPYPFTTFRVWMEVYSSSP